MEEKPMNIPAVAAPHKDSPRPFDKESERDLDWTLAMSYALGIDSGFRVPIVPSIDAFRELFNSIRDRDAPTQKPADGAEPVAWMVTAARNGEINRTVWFSKPDAEVMVDALKNNKRNSFITTLYTHPAPAPAAAAGKVLVPAEPTEAMVDAGNRYNFSASTHLTAKGIYKAMLAAAKEGE